MRYRHKYCARPAYAYAYHSHRPRHSATFGYETRMHRGSNFGVRRPLRYLRYHLDLDDSQSRRMAAVLNRLKLEREQAKVDEKRTVHALSDLVASGDVLAEELKAALSGRLTTAERMQNETVQAVSEICDILDDDQREQFAELVRSGVLSI